MQQKSAQKQTPETRPLDPGVLQNRASDPAHSAWVGASAGTGKTKVLTERILRLLLPRANGQNGTRPHKILALTFTKAAASEMALRLSKTLGRWAVAEEAELHENLAKLLGRPPEAEDLTAARRLFAEVIDAPGGLQIMTIHAFCQSVLGRFPLEAGVPPHFAALEDADSALLLSRARDSVFKQAEREKTSPLSAALRRIAAAINEDAFFKLIRGMARERGQLETLLARHFGAEGLAGVIYDSLNLPRGLTPADIVREFCTAAPEAELRQAAAALLEGTGTKEPFYGRVIQNWLDSPPEIRAQNFEPYRSVFLTKEGTVRASGFPVKKTAQNLPALPDILRRESMRVIAAVERINAATCAELTGDLLRLGEAILANYAGLKQERAALDFDDLILLTRALVQRDGMTRWVQYKLDQGLDHILIDEAQDTNPEQWDIIDALCAAFFEGEGAKDEARTVFTVGDEKQSIYSFQRASPKEFDRMRAHFRQKARDAQQGWEDVDLHISFRSTESVLRAVDAVFTAPEMRAGLGLKDIQHESFRRGQAGLVELWPLCETPEKQDIDYWQPPVEIEEDTAGSQALAGDIAERIKNWIGREDLPSRGRKVEAGDILILVRTRTAFVTQIARALKDLGVPVSGMDRMRLNDQIAVQDLLAFAEFALLPGDDLTLATILKSPLIGIDEDTLYDLAIDRKASLWAEVQHKAPAIAAYLRDVMDTARESRPFGFFSRLLQEPCPADTISGLRAMRSRLGLDCVDPLDELLSEALRFEKDHIASLQLFLHWQKNNEAEIKREMEERGREVRIMTVHGAKGLQAPIVILPDTIRSTRAAPTQADARLLWPDKTDLAVPLWSPRKSMDAALYTKAQETLHDREDEEYRRLLYVALTRAEDRLYIGGYTTRKTAREDSWYFAVKAGLERLEHTQELEDGMLRLTNPQNKDADKAETKNQQQRKEEKAPAWLFAPAPPEESPPRPLMPSRPAEAESPASSPLAKADTYRFRRGNLTHTLLQFLPDLPEQNRRRAAEYFIAQNGKDLSKEICAEIVKETLAVLNHPEFAPVFGPGSRAEVPVTGLVEGNQIISGQIDRLLITDSVVYIIDFKTNRPPPHKVEDVPAIYRRQMHSYADILRRIYPNRAIRCALLWTDGPFLLPLPQALR